MSMLPDAVAQIVANTTEKMQMNDGYIRTPNAVEDALLASPLSRRQERVFRAVLRKTVGFSKPTDCIATSQIAGMTRLDESDVRKALNDLVDFGMLSRGRRTKNGTFYTPNLSATEWEMEANPQTWRFTSNTTPNRVNHPEQTGRIAPHNRQLQQTVKPIRALGSEIHAADAAVPAHAGTRSSKSKLDPKRLIDLFHENCPSLQGVKLLSDSRKQQMRNRWRQAAVELGRYKIDDVDAGLEWWARFFATVENSNFLSGRETKWKANFDWLMKQNNFAKVIEGNYLNQGPEA